MVSKFKQEKGSQIWSEEDLEKKKDPPTNGLSVDKNIDL